MPEEYELFKKYKETGDKKIRDELIIKYTYMAKILAYKFVRSGVDYDDLYQVACMGLMLSVERFDPDRGVQFATFATPTVLGELRKFLRDKAGSIKIPRRLYEIFCRAETLKRQQENLSIDEIAQLLDMPRETLVEAYRVGDAAFIKSLEDEAYTDGGLSVSGLIGFDDEGFTLIENRDFMDYCMSQMTEREAELFNARFHNGITQKELAKKWGVSQMYISRMEKKVTQKFRDIYLADLHNA
jgi:RNA polymerase sigma-B factor